MQPNDKVRVTHKDATGTAKHFNGKIVKAVQPSPTLDDHRWLVDIGAVAIVFNEGDIHAIESSDAQVQGGQAAIGQQVGSQGQKP